MLTAQDLDINCPFNPSTKQKGQCNADDESVRDSKKTEEEIEEDIGIKLEDAN